MTVPHPSSAVVEPGLDAAPVQPVQPFQPVRRPAAHPVPAQGPVFGARAAALTAPASTRVGAPRALATPASVRDAVLARVLVALVVTALAVLIISGRVVTEGPVLLVLSRTHGVHLGDLYAVAGWALVVALQLPGRRARW